MHTYILQIETATSVCSVAIAKDGLVVANKSVDEPNIHASYLTVLIDEMMQQAQLEYRQLSAVAVSKGPGSYTGLRIGVSSAKGMAFALDIPLIAVNTLEMMQSAVQRTEGAWVCPMIDARRMEVFTALYDAQGVEICPTEAKIIDDGSYADILQSHQVYFVGNGADKCREVLAHSNACFLELNVNQASYMTVIAYQKYLQKDFEDVAYFEPFYLKEYVPTLSKKNLLG